MNSDWDTEDDERCSYKNAAGSRLPRNVIYRDQSYELELLVHGSDPFPKSTEDEVYIGNALHHSICKMKDGTSVHFAEVIVLFQNREDEQIRRLASAKSSSVLSRADTKITVSSIRRARNFEQDGWEIYKDTYDAAYAIKQAKRDARKMHKQGLALRGKRHNVDDEEIQGNVRPILRQDRHVREGSSHHGTLRNGLP